MSLENDLTVRAKTTEISIGDFSSGSYATIFGEEVYIGSKNSCNNAVEFYSIRDIYLLKDRSNRIRACSPR